MFLPATPYHTSLPAPRQRLALVPKEPLERGMRAADDVMKFSLGIYIPMHACMSHIGAITCALAAIPSFSHALQKYSCLLHSRNGILFGNFRLAFICLCICGYCLSCTVLCILCYFYVNIIQLASGRLLSLGTGSLLIFVVCPRLVQVGRPPPQSLCFSLPSLPSWPAVGLLSFHCCMWGPS